jgi:hypothetical protein
VLRAQPYEAPRPVGSVEPAPASRTAHAGLSRRLEACRTSVGGHAPPTPAGTTNAQLTTQRVERAQRSGRRAVSAPWARRLRRFDRKHTSAGNRQLRIIITCCLRTHSHRGTRLLSDYSSSGLIADPARRDLPLNIVAFRPRPRDGKRSRDNPGCIEAYSSVPRPGGAPTPPGPPIRTPATIARGRRSSEPETPRIRAHPWLSPRFQALVDVPGQVVSG